MSLRSASRPRGSVLTLQTLEGREVPAGVLTASLSPAGLFTITGDDQSNVITIKRTGTDVTLTPDATTAVNTAAPGVAVVLTGVANSLKADLKGGNDAIAIDGASAFDLSGVASFKLGDGSDMVALATTQILELGGLTVTGGEGDDQVLVDAGVGLGEVSGTTKLDLGLGAAFINFDEIKFTGSGGVKVTSDMGSGAIGLTATNSPVTKTLAVSGGNSLAPTSVNLTGTTVGGLSVSGKLGAVVGLTTSPVNGNVNVKGGFQAQLTTTSAIAGNVNVKSNFQSQVSATGTTIGGNIDLTGGFTGVALISTTPVAGNVSVKSSFQSQLSLADSAVAGNATLAGEFASTLTSGGVSSVRNATVGGGFQSQFQAGGTSLTVNGNLSIRGALANNVTFNTAALSEVKGNFSIKGGTILNNVNANQFFKANKDVTMTLGDGSNIVTIGNGAAPVAILGNLNIKAGKGLTGVQLNNVAVTKATKISLGAGTDSLSIENGSVFTGVFSADLGAGDDVVSIAQNLGATAIVTFAGKATIKMGAGNDTLLLGKGTGGDAFSKVAFNGAGSKVDGGTNFNTFDDGAPMSYTGLVFNTSIVNFTDPNP